MRYSRLFWIYLKKHGEKTDTPWTRIFFSKIENRMIFKIKRCDIISNFQRLKRLTYLEALRMKITKDENSKNVPQLEITKVVLAQCNFVNNDY